MRRSALVVSIGAVLATLVLTPQGVAASPVGSQSAAALIPLARDMVFDRTHGQVFVSEGTNDQILVADIHAQPIATLTGLPDPTAMLLDPVSNTLYVVVTDGVEAIDTETFALRFFDIGASSCPSSVAMASGLLWFAYGCGADGDIGALDPATGQVTTGLAPGLRLYGGAHVLSDPVHLPDTLLVSDAEVGPTAITRATVSGGASPTLTVDQRVEVDGAAVWALTPDGTRLDVSEGEVVDAFSTADLSLLGEQTSDLDVNQIAFRGDGMLAEGGTGAGYDFVNVYRAGEGTVFRKFRLPADLQRLAFGVVNLFAVVGGTLEALVPKHFTSLTLTADPPHLLEGRIDRVTVHLGYTVQNRRVSLFATPYGGARRLLRSANVDADGNLTASTHVFQRVTFSAVYSGDSQSTSARASKVVTVAARMTDGLTGGYGFSGGYRLYHLGSTPIESATLAPNRAGTCVYFGWEYYDSEVGWVYGTPNGRCVRLDAHSRASTKWLGTGHVGEEVRMAAFFPGNVYNTEAMGTWRYFRITR